MLVCANGCARDRTADDSVDPETYLTGADSLRAAGQNEEAGTRYAFLRDSLAAAGDTAKAWRAQLRWVHLWRSLGELDRAEPGIPLALQLAGNDPVRQARTLYERSIWYDRQGRFEEALGDAHRVFALGEETGDVRAQIDGYNALGRIYSLTGRYREAMTVHERYAALARERGTPAELALALNELGIDYRHFGRYEDAARVYEEALAVYRDLGDTNRIAPVLFNYGNIRLETGDLDAALQLWSQALEIAERTGNTYGEALCHEAIGAVYVRVGNHDAARRHLSRGLEISARAPYTYTQVSILEHLGRIELARGELDQARDHFEESLVLADAKGYGRQRALIREGLSRLATRHGNTRDALRHATASVLIADSLEDPDARLDAQVARANALEAGHDRRATEAYLEAIDLLESWRGRLALGDLRMGVSDSRTEVYEGAIRTMTARGRFADALQIAERARARLLLELMADRGNPADTIARSEEERIRDQLREVYASWARQSPGVRDTLDPVIDRLTGRLAALERSAWDGGPAMEAARHPRPVATSVLQTGLLRDGRELLAYFWGEEAVYGWRVTADTALAVRLGDADSLEQLVTFVRATVEDESTAVNWKTAAHHLFTRFVAPLTGTNAYAPPDLFVVPDGPLAHLPLEVLTPGEDAAPWGATTRIVYGPSASILLRLASSVDAEDPPARSLLAVGNPDTDALPPLPFAEVEARAIHDLYVGDGADILVGARATPAGVLALDPSRYRLLHFATHAVVNDRKPGQTHLLLASGRLGVDRIRGLDLNAALVTLSGCDTGLGPRVRGEGVIGLPHAFLAAGARGVVVTQWRVEDRSTSEFMQAFYRELKGGRSPADALLTVRHTLLNEDTQLHPARWAPFILVGGLAI